MEDYEWTINQEEKTIKLVRRSAPKPKRDGLWAHCAATICVESRYRIKWSKLDPPRKFPKLSIQDVIDDVRCDDVHDVMNWMAYMGPTTEKISPFKGERQSFHLYSEDWPRFPIDSHLRFWPQKYPSHNMQLRLQLNSGGPFLATFIVSRDYAKMDHKTQIYMGVQDQGPQNHVMNEVENEIFQPGDTLVVSVIGDGCKNNVNYWVYLNNLGKGWARRGKGMVAKSAVEAAYVPIIA